MFIEESRLEFFLFFGKLLEYDSLREGSPTRDLDEFTRNFFEFFICLLESSFPLFA